MGKVAITKRPSVTNQQINSIIVDQPNSSLFVYYVLSTKEAEIRQAAGGSAQPILNKSAFGQLPIVLPPPSQQHAIAYILSSLDDKIELNRRMNDTLEAMARALFKSWFVDFDPVRAKAEGRAPSGMDEETAKLFPSGFEDSELGEIPMGWTATPLYDIATYINGAAYAAFEPNEDRRGLPIIKIAELKAGVTTQTKFSDVSMPEKYRLSRGDILFSWSGNPDTSIDTFVWAHESAWLNQHIFRVIPHNADERSYVLSTLKYLKPTFAEIARNKQTTGLGHVTVADMKRLLIARPDAKILSAWAAIAGSLFEQIFHNDVSTTTLTALRDALLPRLLSGELDVSDAERFAGAAS
ncbi:MAG: restriction endonuclease subunit S [Deltaproteobacteria bacterium]|nr:restriction endonuclease subunit S [Deltaproteobacteria bacterium]MBK7066763.1 restriction endonuclease subunit S [Deltaproteobacteria bacterium]